MFTFRNTTLAFFVLFFSMNLLIVAGIPVSFWFYGLLIFFYLFISVLLSFRICSGFHMKVTCHGDRKVKKIALTFDDGPDPIITPRVLDVLKKENIQATFFLVGKNLEGNESLVNRIIRDGHAIGGHSYSHSNWFDFFSWKRMKKEFVQTEERIMDLTGTMTRWFRPPYGVINPMVRKAIVTRNYFVAGYSNRLWDTVATRKDILMARFRKNLRPGDIVLLHDTSALTAEILPELIRCTKDSRLSIVPLHELLNIDPYDKV